MVSLSNKLKKYFKRINTIGFAGRMMDATLLHELQNGAPGARFSIFREIRRLTSYENPK